MLTLLYRKMTKRGYLNRYFFISFGIALVLLVACRQVEDPEVVVTKVVVEGEEQVITRVVQQVVIATPAAETEGGEVSSVSLDIGLTGNIPVFDPQMADSSVADDLVQNLFVGLTNFNPVTNVVEPELAKSWEVTDNGRTWIFHLRDDIFWVRPAGLLPSSDRVGEIELIRPVTAEDVVFAVHRVCQRETQTPDAFMLFLITGCEQVYMLDEATPGDLQNIGIHALNDTTLQVTLTKPASQFLTITSLGLFSPVPREVVSEMGDAWTTAENLLTSGPFFVVSGLEERSIQLVLQRNPLWPIPRGGNVELVHIFFSEDEDNAYKLWQAKALDMVPAPNGELDQAIAEFPQKTIFVPEQTVFYLGFNYGSGVFREPEVRRAFSAAIDREQLVEEIFDGHALPMRHLTPPGVFGAPPPEEVGLGYSPDYARQQLAESGFRSCRLIPPIRFLVTSNDLSLQQAELIRDMWIKELGCTKEQIVIEQVSFGALLANTRQDATGARPDVWELGWASYYPDAHNWLADLLHCTLSENRQMRSCSDVDEMILQASVTMEIADRLRLYRQVEDRLFGGDGEMPLAPLYARGNYWMVHTTWLDVTLPHFGGLQYDTVVVDAKLKELEQSR
ncbi:MAG: peptide ABC transporter substrate-binding protein [Chloroflexi bacterium]|nr:MAG: peptide ABC transporter substrate-binding protein [Chloroflexota bacterium]